MNSYNNSSVWITANAGSGKTTYLTRRVVTLLLQGVVPERICCITYTKAAASEMRGRILAQLRALVVADAAGCVARLSDILGRAPTEVEITRARGLFGAMLDSTSGGVVLTTIHGFCQTLLSRFPLEAGVAPHFTVLEDDVAERLLARAKFSLLSAYDGADRTLSDALSLIGLRSKESRFGDYITAISRQRGLWEEIWRGQTPSLLKTRLYALHGLTPEMTDAALLQHFCDVLTEDEAIAIRASLPELLAKSTPKIEVLCDWLAGDDMVRASLCAEFEDIFLKKTDGLPRSPVIAAKYLQKGLPLHSMLAEIAERVCTIKTQRAALACAEESYAMAIVAEALLDLYRQEKEARHALDYDDLIGKTRALLSHPGMIGWVMSKLDHRIDHLFVDEAQDTSGEQWSIAEVLVEELIAATGGYGSGDVPRSLLVVGDEKQSIYSFQGADPALFGKKQHLFGQVLSGSDAPLRRDRLATSYRSAEALLRLVDALAAQPEIAASLSADGVTETHLLHRRDAAGLVALYPPLSAPEKLATAPLTLPTEYHTEQTLANLLAEQVAETVAQWLANGRLLESEGRPIHPGDILILLRKRAPLMLPLIRALERRGVPVAGLDRLMLAEHLAVKDLLALMRWVTAPGDDLALAQVLRSPLIGISDGELRALCVGRDGMLYARITGESRGWLNAARDAAALPPYAFLARILMAEGTRRRFAARFGNEVHEVLDEFMAQAAAFRPVDRPASLANFVDGMERSPRVVKRELESGAAQQVRIMTVHGSKGLEAPVVLLPDITDPPTTGREVVFTATDRAGQLFPVLALSDAGKGAAVLTAAKEAKSKTFMAEYHRLLYVALTRARDELHLWGKAGKNGPNPRSWYGLAAGAMRTLEAADEQGVLILRDVRPPVVTRVKEAAAVMPALPAWASDVAPRVARMASFTPSSLAPALAVSPYAASSGGERTRGVVIHRVLELLRAEHTEDDIARLLRLIAPDWSTPEQTSAVTEIAALLRAEPWIWQYPSQAEVALCGTVTLPMGEIAVNGQIDRLVDTPEGMVVLDYKTGRHIPASVEEIPANYLVQLKTYAALLAQIYPGRPIRTAIIWTAGARLFWCDAAVKAARWPNENVMGNAPLVA